MKPATKAEANAALAFRGPPWPQPSWPGICADLHGTKASIDEMAAPAIVNLPKRSSRPRGRAKACWAIWGGKSFWRISTAINRARAFEKLGVVWPQEPLGHDDLEGHRTLLATSGIQFAQGKQEWHARSIQRILDAGPLDVRGLAPLRIKEIVACRKPAQLCTLYRRQANAHNFSAAIVGAASQALGWSGTAFRLLAPQPVYGPAQNEDKSIWRRTGVVNHPERPGLMISADQTLVGSKIWTAKVAPKIKQSKI